jgi:hypothetical protein
MFRQEAVIVIAALVTYLFFLWLVIRAKENM